MLVPGLFFAGVTDKSIQVPFITHIIVHNRIRRRGTRAKEANMINFIFKMFVFFGVAFGVLAVLFLIWSIGLCIKFLLEMIHDVFCDIIGMIGRILTLFGKTLGALSFLWSKIKGKNRTCSLS